jgi:hypothetical protein
MTASNWWWNSAEDVGPSNFDGFTSAMLVPMFSLHSRLARCQLRLELPTCCFQVESSRFDVSCHLSLTTEILAKVLGLLFDNCCNASQAQWLSAFFH